MKTQAAFWCLLLLASAGAPAHADSEAPNRPHVTAGQYGQCYVKSVPNEYWGEGGETALYKVAAERDELLARYNWFSQQIFLKCNTIRNGVHGVSVVRFGPWARGHTANAQDLALELYFNGELLARYSTLDIAGSPENVDASVSHYQVLRNIIGYRLSGADGSNDYEFAVETTDGRTITFDTTTGARTAQPPEQ